MYLFPISFIAQFIISALRAVLLIPGPHFPVPLSLTHIQSCYLRPGTEGAELTLRDTGTMVNPFLLCKLRPHVVTSASSVVWLQCGQPLCKHEALISSPAQRKVHQETDTVCVWLPRWDGEVGWVSMSTLQTIKSAYNDIWHSVCNSNKS